MPRPLSPAVLTTERARHAISLDLNPNIDRAPAEVNNPCDSKLCIMLNHTFPTAHGQIKYSHPVDWSSSKSVSKLNKWRNRTFLYWFGPLPEEYQRRTEYVRFREDEKLWLLRERNLEKGRFEQWERIAERFNERFEREGRPRRTRKQLCNLYNHMIQRGVSAPVDLAGRENDGGDSESELEEGEIREDRPSEQDWRAKRPWEL